jgi:signal transduction histidine kinase
MTNRANKIRVVSYLLTAVVLFTIYILLEASTWAHGNTQLHTIMEAIATLLALVVGAVALVRYYARRQNMILFLGVGFFGTALLDGYHAVVTSTFFHHLFPSAPPSLIPWSWNASRTFLAILMFLSWLAWRRERKLGTPGQISDKAVYLGVFSLTFASFCIFAFVPLGRAYFPEFIFGRPEEFVSAAFFLAALFGYLSKGGWKDDVLEHWIVNSLIVGFLCQAIFMSRSYTLFDGMFDMAHLLKIVSYGLVLIGLLADVYVVWQREQATAGQLQRANETLEQRVQERTKNLEESRVAAVQMMNEIDKARADLARQATELKRSNEDLEQFAHVASHDLQEPLRKVASFCELLRIGYREQLDDKAQQYIDFAVDGAVRMKKLIGDLLDFSRVGTRGRALEPTDARKACDRAIEILRPAINESGATVTRSDLPTIRADEVQLTQLFQNLIGNAIKYVGDQSPVIQLAAQRNGNEWHFSVSDNGIGIDSKHADRIFVIFQRLHGRGEYEGTGIGLAICKRIVERTGGRIWVESSEGQGSTFYFTAPVIPVVAAVGG